jgi:hypothetical protein
LVVNHSKHVADVDTIGNCIAIAEWKIV